MKLKGLILGQRETTEYKMIDVGVLVAIVTILRRENNSER